MNGFVKACAVTALLSQLTPSTQGAEAEAVPQPPQAKNDPLETILHPGPFEIRPHLTMSVFYDDNIFLRPTNRVDDVVWMISPGILVGTGAYRDGDGSFFLLDYTPTVTIFTDNDDSNGQSHDVLLAGQWKTPKLTLALDQTYNGSFGGLFDATNRVDREVAGGNLDRQTYATTVRGEYQFSDKTGFELDGRQIIRDYEGFSSYNDWALASWVNYQPSEKLRTSAGATVGWRDIEANPNQMYEQLLVRGSYHVAEKVTALASIGMEFQQYQGGDSRGPTLIFGMGGEYRPREGTVLSLEAYRREQTSIYLSGQNYTITGFRAAARQRILDRLSATLATGYDFSDYHRTTSGTDDSRQDGFFYIGPGVDYEITERWMVGLFYQYRQNSSNADADQFDYQNHQVGLRTSFRF
jgi:opacity protein-like surface antigen